jgi:hypothetical protein
VVRGLVIALAAATASLLAVSGTTVHAKPTSPALVGQADSSSLVQVVCATTYGPIGQAKFAYRMRPHTCLFHKPGTPVDEANLVAGSRLHWLRWGEKTAVGKGESAENMVGLIPMDVRLLRPLAVCGHTIFSKAQFKFPKSGGGYGRPVALDRSVGNC